MKHGLRILNLEDDHDDFELIRRTLVREGVDCEIVRVETRETFVEAMEEGGFDLILADFSLPSFDGFSALDIAKEKRPEVPFIFVSGAIGEDSAIETLKKGARDYVLKERLSRLAPALKRALIEVEEHARRRQAERDLEVYQRRLEELVRERTDELNRANEQLHRELAERLRAEDELKKMNRELEEISITDGLTGIYNSRHFYTRLEEEMQRAERYDHPLSVIIADVDYFKHYNDTHGHLMGDAVLKHIASCLKKCLRESDLVARYGGEEFSIILPEIGKGIAGKTAERIREILSEQPFLHKESQPGGNLTISLGVATFPDDARNVKSLMGLADSALYRAKERGRNRVETA